VDQNLYIGCNGNVAKIDPQSGAELWRVKLKPGVLSATTYEDVSVIVRDGVIYAGCNGHIFALSPDGQILWHNPLKGVGYNDISLAFEGQSVQYIQKTVHQHSSSGSNT
jgi:outer membrane protein assembly factor BamB